MVFSRNSVFSQLNPDCKNTELLKDYTREGEPIGRLKVNAIENHDNTHEIAFKNYINWLVNKQLQEKDDHQGNIEPDISVLKPDFTDVNILEEVTTKGELVLCLDAHDVESYDGDTDTEKLTFNDDTRLMADKQLKKEKLYGRINELHIPYTSLLQKTTIMLFTKRKHCKKCFNSKIIHDASNDDSPKQNFSPVTNKNKGCGVSWFSRIASLPEAYRNTEKKNDSFDILHFTNSGLIGKTLKNEPKNNKEAPKMCGVHDRLNNNSVQEPNVVKSGLQNNLVQLTCSDISETKRHIQGVARHPKLDESYEGLEAANASAAGVFQKKLAVMSLLVVFNVLADLETPTRFCVETYDH
ncbi:hypothetical protein NDU88_007438 [Pleurodeles waltl]|uniref:Uncharacterized protein n=1 Tax=Pleurodeles waltl TaxID=8319 RepID=A0AAV7VSJ1_PLEWA|nr:hypothetical protein NDU88_007438 [Pleurodeles waltl]